jgi:hypothetical protein
VPVSADGITARLSAQKIYVDGQAADLSAYNIADHNYVRLRDVGRAVDFGVFYDESQDSVRLNNTIKYRQLLNEAAPIVTGTASAAA